MLQDFKTVNAAAAVAVADDDDDDDYNDDDTTMTMMKVVFLFLRSASSFAITTLFPRGEKKIKNNNLKILNIENMYTIINKFNFVFHTAYESTNHCKNR